MSSSDGKIYKEIATLKEEIKSATELNRALLSSKKVSTNDSDDEEISNNSEDFNNYSEDNYNNSEDFSENDFNYNNDSDEDEYSCYD